jgi:fumarylacetoacetase
MTLPSQPALPYAAFTYEGSEHIGVGVGDQILDLHRAVTTGLLDTLAKATRDACLAPYLNPLMALPSSATSDLRAALLTALDSDPLVELCLTPLSQITLHLPCVIGDYTDFYASLHHATNVGRLFRPDDPLLPNYKHLPVGYHGRSSSLAISPDTIRRPGGQRRGPESPIFGPTQALDYELELGIFIRQGNDRGTPIPLDAAEDHIFGLCLLNDWSARDIQSWEYQPLGPFLGKNFATTISPWIIPYEALAPCRVAAPEHPHLLPYLAGPTHTFDVQVEAHILTPAMREQGTAPHLLSRANLQDLYWSPAHLIAHHTVNGCNLRPGDLLGTGTISGQTEESLGCLLEITRAGSQPVTLPTGETRTYLEDGDQITLAAFCQREGLPPLSFGTCTGTITS